jgi:hypothetical protein
MVSSFFRPAVPKTMSVNAELVKSSTMSVPKTETNLNATPVSPSQSQNGTNVDASRLSLPSTTATKPVSAPKTTEAAYYCGAATKKGTPCSRRVKRPGERCWQHQGMPSMVDDNGTSRK